MTFQARWFLQSIGMRNSWSSKKHQVLILCPFKGVRISVFIYACMCACMQSPTQKLDFQIIYNTKKYFLGDCKMPIEIVELLSQNHREVEVGRDFCRLVIWYNPSDPKDGHLEQAAQDLFQIASEDLQRWRLHNFSWQPMPGLSQPPQWKTVSSYSDRVSFIFLLLVLSVGTTEKGLSL